MRLRNKREIKKACAFNICVINCISCNGVFGAVIMQRLVDLSRKEVISMKEGIHPEYKECKVTCACGNTFMTKSHRKRSERTFAQRAIHSLQDSRNSHTEADELKNSRTSTILTKKEDSDNRFSSETSFTHISADVSSKGRLFFYGETFKIFLCFIL